MEDFIFIICHTVMASCGIVLIGIGMKFRSERLDIAHEQKIKTTPGKASRMIIEDEIDRSLHFPVGAQVSV